MVQQVELLAHEGEQRELQQARQLQLAQAQLATVGVPGSAHTPSRCHSLSPLLLGAHAVTVELAGTERLAVKLAEPVCAKLHAMELQGTCSCITP